MRICFVTPEDLPVPPVRGGSVQIYTHSLLQRLASMPDIEPILLSPNRRQQSGVLPEHRKTPYQHYEIDFDGKTQYAQKVMDLVRTLAPDIVEVENRPKLASMMKSKFHLPTILNLYSTTFLGPRHIPATLVPSHLEPLDRVVLISQYLQQTIVQRFHLRDRQWRPTIIYPGVDAAQFAFAQRAEQSFTVERPLQILFVGRVILQKGVQVLVDTVKRLTDAGYPVSLTVVGKTHPWEKRYESSLKQSAAGYPITFTGFVEPVNLSPYYRSHDVFVCPSQYGEAFGMVNLEALACGLPVIGSRVGGITEILTEDCGILVDNVRDPESFRAAIAYLLRTPGKLLEMSRHAQKRAEQFTWNRTARAFADLYRSL